MFSIPATDKYAVCCNFKENYDGFPKGGVAYLVFLDTPGSAPDRVCILARNRYGRWAETWQKLESLTTFRSKTFPQSHPLFNDERIATLADREKISDIASLLQKRSDGVYTDD